MALACEAMWETADAETTGKFKASMEAAVAALATVPTMVSLIEQLAEERDLIRRAELSGLIDAHIGQLESSLRRLAECQQELVAGTVADTEVMKATLSSMSGTIDAGIAEMRRRYASAKGVFGQSSGDA